MEKEERRHCTVCHGHQFERNNYFYGKLMTDRDFFAEQRYFNRKRWLINRTVLGWGVVCGLDVVPLDKDLTKVLVKPGLAIDSCGREIMLSHEREVQLVPEESECEKEEAHKCAGGRELAICIEFHECKAEHLPMPAIACDQKGRGEFNRIRDSFGIRVLPMSDRLLAHQGRCPAEMESESLHHLLTDATRKERHGHDSHYGHSHHEHDYSNHGHEHCQPVVLATVCVNGKGERHGGVDIYSHSRLVYGNTLLYKLINCLHHDYISTWLVLGPIYNATHQTTAHHPNDNHPIAASIITSNDNFDPAKIAINSAPSHGDVVFYKNHALDISGDYTWKTRNFIGMDWMNIHDIEDNIHQHLPGDYADPHDVKKVENFAGKHHAIAYFLVYIVSPADKATRLYVRSDDALRVWLNAKEIDVLRHVNDRNIEDFAEDVADIKLKAGTNIFVAAVAETHFEWGFSVRLEDSRGLRFTSVKP